MARAQRHTSKWAQGDSSWREESSFEARWRPSLQLDNAALAMPKEKASLEDGVAAQCLPCADPDSVSFQFFAFLTTLLYILHAFSIYYH